MIETIVALTACFANPPAAAENGIEPRGCIELATYTSKTECQILLPRLKIHAKGARLTCHVRELSYEERHGLVVAR